MSGLRSACPTAASLPNADAQRQQELIGQIWPHRSVRLQVSGCLLRLPLGHTFRSDSQLAERREDFCYMLTGDFDQRHIARSMRVYVLNAYTLFIPGQAFADGLYLALCDMQGQVGYQAAPSGTRADHARARKPQSVLHGSTVTVKLPPPAG